MRKHIIGFLLFTAIIAACFAFFMSSKTAFITTTRKTHAPVYLVGNPGGNGFQYEIGSRELTGRIPNPSNGVSLCREARISVRVSSETDSSLEWSFSENLKDLSGESITARFSAPSLASAAIKGENLYAEALLEGCGRAGKATFQKYPVLLIHND